MKKWEIKIKFVGGIVELPDDAVVLRYDSDEDNGESVTYMVPAVDTDDLAANKR